MKIEFLSLFRAIFWQTAMNDLQNEDDLAAKITRRNTKQNQIILAFVRACSRLIFNVIKYF